MTQQFLPFPDRSREIYASDVVYGYFLLTETDGHCRFWQWWNIPAWRRSYWGEGWVHLLTTRGVFRPHEIGCSYRWRLADTPQTGMDLQSPLRFQSMGQLGVAWCVWVHGVCALGSRLGMGCSCVLSLPLACLFLESTPFPLLAISFWQCPGVSDELCRSFFSSIWKGPQDGVLDGWDR